jgi:hypothetical protein
VSEDNYSEAKSFLSVALGEIARKMCPLTIKLEFQNPIEVIQMSKNEVWTPFERFSNLTDNTSTTGEGRSQNKRTLIYDNTQENYPVMQTEMYVSTPTLEQKTSKINLYVSATTGGTMISGMTTPQTTTQGTNYSQDHILKDQVTILQETVKTLEIQMKTLSVDTGKNIAEMGTEIKIMESNITTSLRHEITTQNKENREDMLASLALMIKDSIKETIKESVNQNMNLAMTKKFGGPAKKKNSKLNLAPRSVVTRSSTCTRRLSNESNSSMEDIENQENEENMSQIEFTTTDEADANVKEQNNN